MGSIHGHIVRTREVISLATPTTFHYLTALEQVPLGYEPFFGPPKLAGF